jgi:hypothetical protein
MKKAVVTYNFGNYDKMPSVLWDNHSEWDLIAYTDEKTRKKIPEDWSTVVLPKPSEIPHITDLGTQAKRVANYVKYKPFELLSQAVGDYDLIVVMDANFQIVGDLNEAVERLLLATSDACFMAHPTIKSVYDDIDLAVKLNKIDREVGEHTKKIFKADKVPINDPNYCQTGFSIRRNTSGWRHFEYIWWDAYNQISNRDQPAFNGILNKFPTLDINVSPKNEIEAYVKYNKHCFEEDS